jgi:16S rRNA C967 or C1407 C5-methylase (RsmB/RsmF family)
MERMSLPEAFVKTTVDLMGEERFSRYLASFGEEVPVSIRINPKRMEGERWSVEGGEPVPWCRHAYYLSERPNFTFDPLLHAGCYYVQEAASMFLDEVLRQHLPALNQQPSSLISQPSTLISQPSTLNSQPSSLNSQLSTLISQLSSLNSLDLCAAPGGKSTLMRSALPEGSVLYSNEPVAKRASILLENITKWGYPGSIVTNSYPRDYVRSGLMFDLILCDVPCSGEGMFRKDPQTIGEWSPQNVEKCWRLQRDIVSDAWQCLSSGGLLIYSTCTFNIKENEENIRWIMDTFDAELLPVATDPSWGITGSLLKDFDAPVYRFIPGITRSEGLFMAVLRKGGSPLPCPTKEQKKGHRGVKSQVLQVMSPIPHREGLEDSGVDLTFAQAIAYLRGEALVLPAEVPRGIVNVTFMGHPLGQVKNLGTRANNLYPKEWRIKSTRIPTTFVSPLIS